jgi:hypothetical protein
LTLLTVKDKYGSDFEEDEENLTTDSESDQSEDEDGEELTPTMDVAIFRTLARIKRRDPEIYDTGKGVFNGMFLSSAVNWPPIEYPCRGTKQSDAYADLTSVKG